MKCERCGHTTVNRLLRYEVYNQIGKLITSDISERSALVAATASLYRDLHVYDTLTETGYHIRLEKVLDVLANL